MNRKTINKYEWETRLGSISNQLAVQARNLRGFRSQFPEKLDVNQHDLIDKLGNSCEQLAIMVKEIEQEIHK